ncbi:antibiotic biosynthesis monooxygenase family protein [Actinomycetospora sp. OC33-EN08]|uniref:Antibiotic biosynthesis monooxygenase family protein n=1 Tax=Actinomycetospora aurantiaca TaxID=3129233 RepID=A0ABU8MSI9_9PSEU
MSELAVWATIDVLPGRQAEAEEVFARSRRVLEAEPGTTSFFVVRIDDTTYGIFDTFADRAALEAHIEGDSGRDHVNSLVGSVFAAPPVITTATLVERAATG